MKKVLLVGINAKFIHSNLAIRYLQKYAGKFGRIFHIVEFTINQLEELILSEIYQRKPDVLGFSCYIWNILLIKRIIQDVKKILPETVVVLGGPEITDDYCGADYIISGTGEKAFFELVSAIEECSVPKLPGKAFDFSETVFPYSDEDFEALNGRIIYYETQRGCPFKCAYCLSSGSEGVSFLPIERVYCELNVFLEKKVRQVKLVDRTFNCNKDFRRNIWKYLIDNDNGITNFHFEITAGLLDGVDFEILKKARKSLFQFEIGVQSTCEKTLMEIERMADFDTVSSNVKMLAMPENIHLHLDLIAGLPHESFESFKKSFNDVFALRPDMLQLGFLKLLKGSKIRIKADEYGMAYSNYPPYEVLKTKDISYGELIELKNAEHMLESYYNSGLARRTIEFILRFFDSPFDLFHSFGLFWNKMGYGYIQHSKMKMYERLYEFFVSIYYGIPENNAIIKEAIVYDVLSNDNVKTFPEVFSKPLTIEQERYVSELLSDAATIGNINGKLLQYDKKQLRKRCCIAFFDYAVYDDFTKRDRAVFFHYLSENSRGSADVLEWRRGK